MVDVAARRIACLAFAFTAGVLGSPLSAHHSTAEYDAGSPEGTVQAYLQAVTTGDYAEAATLLNKGGARWSDAFKRSIGVALKDEEDLHFISPRLDALIAEATQ